MAAGQAARPILQMDPRRTLALAPGEKKPALRGHSGTLPQPKVLSSAAYKEGRCRALAYGIVVLIASPKSERPEQQ